MEMLNNQLFIKVKPLIECKLREYPYYLMSVEMPGLGSAIAPDVIINRSSSPSDIVGSSVVNNEYKKIVVDAVNYIYDKLDKESKTIIDNTYFTGIKSREELINELKISRKRYYKLKNNALYKFGIAFGML